MKFSVLACAALLFSGSYAVAETKTPWLVPLSGKTTEGTKAVQVLGHTWTVSPAKNKTAAYVAVRDNNDNRLFGIPAVRRTPQAVRAIELATGCKVERTTMVQDTSARFYASVTCK